MEVTYLWPPWLSGSYHPRLELRPLKMSALSKRAREVRAIITVPLYMENLYRPRYYSSSPRFHYNHAIVYGESV
jgi:hypothetical protein